MKTFLAKTVATIAALFGRARPVAQQYDAPLPTVKRRRAKRTGTRPVVKMRDPDSIKRIDRSQWWDTLGFHEEPRADGSVRTSILWRVKRAPWFKSRRAP